MLCAEDLRQIPDARTFLCVLTRPGITIYGKQWAKYQRVPVLHHNSEGRVAGREACRLREGEDPCRRSLTLVPSFRSHDA